MSRLAYLFVASLGLSCKLDLQRMQAQRRVNPSSDDPLRLAMVQAGHPEGTVAHDAVLGNRAWTEGCSDGRYVASVPAPVSPELLALGRARFATFCAACHGASGDGTSVVAQAMEKRRPRSLLVPPVRDYPPGRVYRSMLLGYRLMPSYRDDLDVRERWAVTAYIESLPGTVPASRAEPTPGSPALPPDVDGPGATCSETSP